MTAVSECPDVREGQPCPECRRLSAAAPTNTIAAHKLAPGDKVFIYGRVPVTIVTAECLPAFQPAKTVATTYRRDFVTGTGHIIGRMTAQATQAFAVWDDEEAF